MINVILCGGSGTRLWPLSRKLFPKQFVNLQGDESLFQMTAKRNSKFCEKTAIVTNRDNYFMALDQITSCGIDRGPESFVFFLEPVGRNTAPAIAIACLEAGDDIVIVTPSDHLIVDDDVYRNAISTAITEAENGNLVTFGMKPLYPETGYGYIETAPNAVFEKAYDVKCFREKPDFDTAAGYVKAGNFFWNSGIFVFKASVYLDELKKYSPSIYEKSVLAFNKAEVIEQDSSWSKNIRIHHDDMNAIPSQSIDFAVMEHSCSVKVVPSNFSWNDLGSFDSLYDVSLKDEHGNTLAENTVNIDSKNNLIVSSERKIALVGLENAIVIDTPDALLIGKRGHSQDVKKVVDYLKAGTEQEKNLADVHSTVSRPWGTYTVLDDGKIFKIKKIVVRPGNRLSLQKHFHRSEHWVVVSGTANVTVDSNEFIVRKNESTYIPIGSIHRLENKGKIDLVIIETQVGEYVGEDDIVRIEDDYKRLEV